MNSFRNSRSGRQRDTIRRQPRHRISPSFIGLIAILFLSGFVMYQDLPFSSTLAPFIFVVSGWVVALCLHEFGHALTAYYGGDTDVAQTGYLTLDPLSYTHPAYSIVMPVLFIILGFIALPGGAVYIRTGRLRSHHWESATFAAGPFMTLFCLCIASAPFALGLPSSGGTPIFWVALAVLAGFLALSIIWNLLPIPGLDGWGIIEPYLPAHIRDAAAGWRQMGPMLLVLAIMLFRPLGSFVFRIAIGILEIMEVPAVLFVAGMRKIMILNIF